jgi:hypothetical protein
MDVRRSIPPRRFAPRLPIGFPAIGLALLLLGGPAPDAPAESPAPGFEAGVGRGLPNLEPDALPVRPAPPPSTMAAVLPDPWFEPGFARPSRIANTYTVTNTADSGPGSLRAAITAANSNPDLDAISFAIPGAGVQTIAPLSPLPDFVQPIVLDGTTQPGFAGTPLIELSGASAGISHGLAIRGGGSTVRGLIINRFAASGPSGGVGIYIDSFGGNTIEGNWIGTNAAGTAAAPNGYVGVLVIGASSQNLIGGTTAAARNVISGNAATGVQLASGGVGLNVVRGNYIGLDPTGTVKIPNAWNGVFVNSPDNTIGGAIVGARNVISGNLQPGIFIAVSAPRTIILGNYIGTDHTGTLDLGNTSNGITSGSPQIAGAPNAVIGNTQPLGGNVIAANDFPGIYLLGAVSSGARIEGNIIGLDATRTIALGKGNGIVVDQANDVVIGGAGGGAGNHVGGTSFPGIFLLNAARTVLKGNVVGLGATPGPGFGNSTGIVVSNSPNTMIGGAGSGEGNTIAGNTLNGIDLRGAGSVDCRVVGNRIGTDAGLASNVGNGVNGIVISGSRNTIGELGAGNVIAFNGKSGVYDSTGVDNPIRYNALRGNGELGIDLRPRGLTINDLLDADTGPNGLINFPYLDSAFVEGNVRRVHGRMEGKPNTTYRIDLYRNEACDPRHFGEAQEHLGEALTVTDGAGNASFQVNLPLQTVPPPTPYITATATDPTGNTSELSQCLCLDDADGDGLMDCWETDGWGIDINHDGVIDLDLFARTARADHKDLFVEIDAMNGYAPPAEVVDQVVAAFADVPNVYLGNPDGLQGINLQAEYSDTNLPVEALPGGVLEAWEKFATIKDANFGSPAERGNPNTQQTLRAKRLVYRYGLWARTYRDSTAWGVGEITDWIADDFIVAMNVPLSIEDQAATFMHEFGHTLGLGHGGGDNIHYKPNYYSIMNYTWVTPGVSWQVPGSWKLDYSRFALDPLDETELDETKGLNVPAGVWPTVSVPFRNALGHVRQTKLRPNNPVDWSGDDLADNRFVVANISNLPVGFSSAFETLTSHADWSNLQYEFRRSKAFTWSGPSSLSRTSVLLADEDPEPGPWLRDLINALPPPRPEGWFVLDGQLDAGLRSSRRTAGRRCTPPTATASSTSPPRAPRRQTCTSSSRARRPARSSRLRAARPARSPRIGRSSPRPVRPASRSGRTLRVRTCR